MQRKILKGLQSYQYEHPFDKKALDTLKSYKFLETLVRTFNAQGIERLLRIQYTGSNVKVNDRNFPEIYYILCEACSILDMPFVPKLYIKWSYGINAMTAGVEDPIIVLNSGAVDLLKKEELLFVLGHELGHIKSMHVLYHQMAQVFPILGRNSRLNYPWCRETSFGWASDSPFKLGKDVGVYRRPGGASHLSGSGSSGSSFDEACGNS